MFLKIFQNFYDFPHFLELEFKVSFELEIHSRIEDINESLGGFRFHPILGIRDLSIKIK